MRACASTISSNAVAVTASEGDYSFPPVKNQSEVKSSPFLVGSASLFAGLPPTGCAPVRVTAEAASSPVWRQIFYRAGDALVGAVAVTRPITSAGSQN